MGQKFRGILIHTLCRHCVRDAYMPMSGVHSTTMVSMSSQRRFTKRNGSKKSGGPGGSINKKPGTDNYYNMHTKLQHLQSGAVAKKHTTQTPNDNTVSTTTATAVAKSAPTQHPTNNTNLSTNTRHVHTYTTDKRTPTHSSRSPAMDSEEETTYDISLEHLLPDQTDSNNTSTKYHTAFKVDHLGPNNSNSVTVC